MQRPLLFFIDLFYLLFIYLLIFSILLSFYLGFLVFCCFFVFFHSVFLSFFTLFSYLYLPFCQSHNPQHTSYFVLFSPVTQSFCVLILTFFTTKNNILFTQTFAFLWKRDIITLIMMLGSNNLLPPLIPDCSVLRTPAILKNIHFLFTLRRKLL